MAQLISIRTIIAWWLVTEQLLSLLGRQSEKPKKVYANTPGCVGGTSNDLQSVVLEGHRLHREEMEPQMVKQI